MNTKTLIAALLGAAPILAFGAGSTGPVVATSYEIDSWDQVLIVNGAWANPDSCGTSSYVIIQMSNSSYKDMFATVLAAGLSGKELSFWVSGCVTGPWGATAPLVLDTTIAF
ncbi:MAG TPA: hypothetical protein VGC34_16995 [Steroidobacteraceae bacterium]